MQEFVEDMRTLIWDRYQFVLGARRGGCANLIALGQDKIKLGETLEDETTDDWHVLAVEASTPER